MRPDVKTYKRKVLRNRWEDVGYGINRCAMVELETPIPRGWIRHYVLSEEAKKRSDVSVLEEILKAINHRQYCYRRDFRMSKSERKRKRTTELYYPMQKLGRITAKWWERQKLDNKGWRKYFVLVLCVDDKGQPSLQYEFKYPRLFVIKTERNWIKQLPSLDSAHMSSITRFWNWVGRNRLTGELYKAMGWQGHPGSLRSDNAEWVGKINEFFETDRRTDEYLTQLLGSTKIH